jgi:hypothetical protein
VCCVWFDLQVVGFDVIYQALIAIGLSLFAIGCWLEAPGCWLCHYYLIGPILLPRILVGHPSTYASKQVVIFIL